MFHVATAVALYAARVKLSFSANDLFVFGMPLLAAAVAYYVTLASGSPSHGIWRAAAASLGLGIASFSIAMFVNLNVFGS